MAHASVSFNLTFFLSDTCKYSCDRASSVVCADAVSCSNYYQCVYGRWIQRSCPPGTGFDEMLETCLVEKQCILQILLRGITTKNVVKPSTTRRRKSKFKYTTSLPPTRSYSTIHQIPSTSNASSTVVLSNSTTIFKTTTEFVAPKITLILSTEPSVQQMTSASRTTTSSSTTITTTTTHPSTLSLAQYPTTTRSWVRYHTTPSQKSTKRVLPSGSPVIKHSGSQKPRLTNGSSVTTTAPYSTSSGFKHRNGTIQNILDRTKENDMGVASTHWVIGGTILLCVIFFIFVAVIFMKKYRHKLK